MLRRTPLSVKVNLRRKIFPVIGSRSGSTATSEHTFVLIVGSVARKSQTSLWQSVGSLPLGQFNAWFASNALPQMQWEGSIPGSIISAEQASASRNAPLWMANL